MQVKADGIDHSLVGYKLHTAATLVAGLRLSELEQCAPIAATLAFRQDGYELELYKLPIHIQANRRSDQTPGLEHPERTAVDPLRNVNPQRPSWYAKPHNHGLIRRIDQMVK